MSSGAASRMSSQVASRMSGGAASRMSGGAASRMSGQVASRMSSGAASRMSSEAASRMSSEAASRMSSEAASRMSSGAASRMSCQVANFARRKTASHPRTLLRRVEGSAVGVRRINVARPFGTVSQRGSLSSQRDCQFREVPPRRSYLSLFGAEGVGGVDAGPRCRVVHVDLSDRVRRCPQGRRAPGRSRRGDAARCEQGTHGAIEEDDHGRGSRGGVGVGSGVESGVEWESGMGRSELDWSRGGVGVGVEWESEWRGDGDSVVDLRYLRDPGQRNLRAISVLSVAPW